MNSIKTIILILIAFLLSTCSDNSNLKKGANLSELPESEIMIIEIEDELSDKKSEFSGLCWYGDRLILLPQFPDYFDHEIGKIFYTKREKIINYINGNSTMPIEFDFFEIDLSGIKEFFTRGSGFESITVLNDNAYFTIEHMNLGKTESLLIRGKIDSVANKITLDSNVAKDNKNLFIYNISDESILEFENKIIPIYELYGKNLNPSPSVSVFDTLLTFKESMKFPNIEYRITDVTSVNEDGIFYGMNYFYPGDLKKNNPIPDPIVEKYGIGRTHLDYMQVERILKFRILENEIRLTDDAPIYLKLTNNESRNWEGIAKLDDMGFLLVTDEFPETIFAFLQTNSQ